MAISTHRKQETIDYFLLPYDYILHFAAHGIQQGCMVLRLFSQAGDLFVHTITGIVVIKGLLLTL